MMDPRLAVIERRLSGVERIIAVTGGKGGIGKSFIASSLALARAGHSVGLLDLDLTGPCDHLILGIHDGAPEEQFGLVPGEAHGIRFMSLSYLIGDRPLPLRGADLSNALIELLTITQWGSLDLLVIDMPPGIGDATLDVLRLLPRAEFLLVATASRVVLDTVEKTRKLLARQGVPIIGVVENMCRSEERMVADWASASALRFVGAVPFDETVEAALGDPAALTATRAFTAVQVVAGAIAAGALS